MILHSRSANRICPLFSIMFRWLVHSGGPETPYQAALTVRHCVYCFGNNRTQIDVYIFNTVTLNWRKLIPVAQRSEGHLEVPSPHHGYTLVLVEGTVLIWGGSCGNQYNNVLYAFDVDALSWFKPQFFGTVPEGRETHSACVLGKVMYVHGGYMGDTTYKYRWTNDLYKLDTNTMVWTLINTRGILPPASSYHSATIIGKKMFVFGGWSEAPCYNTTVRVFDTETETWLNTPSTQLHPGTRCDHSAFAYNGELYVCGGWNRSDFNRFCGIRNASNDSFKNLCKFNPETFSWKEIKPKGKRPRLNYKGCHFVMGDHHVILYGGTEIISTTYRELYILDLSPSLKTLCKLAVIQYDLDHSELPYNIRWELATERTSKK